MNIPTTHFLILAANCFHMDIIPAEIDNDISEGRSISLIKLLRYLTGFGLIEAKKLLDSCSTFREENGFFKRTINREKLWEIILSLPNVQEALRPQPAQSPIERLNEQLLENIIQAIKEHPDCPIWHIVNLCHDYVPEYNAFNPGDTIIASRGRKPTAEPG